MVLYTGRLDPEKAMDVWLRAAGRVAAASDAQFIVGGQGADRPRLERMAKELGLGRRVHFIGYLDAEAYTDLYRLADVYCITAPVELQSISTLEALASGLPVVAVQAGALPELVHDACNGYLVPPEDWRAAGDAVLRLLRDPATRVEMGERSRQLAHDHDVEHSVDRYERLLLAARAEKGERRVERAPASGY